MVVVLNSCFLIFIFYTMKKCSTLYGRVYVCASGILLLRNTGCRSMVYLCNLHPIRRGLEYWANLSGWTTILYAHVGVCVCVCMICRRTFLHKWHSMTQVSILSLIVIMLSRKLDVVLYCTVWLLSRHLIKNLLASHNTAAYSGLIVASFFPC